MFAILKTEPVIAAFLLFSVFCRFPSLAVERNDAAKLGGDPKTPDHTAKDSDGVGPGESEPEFGSMLFGLSACLDLTDSDECGRI